MLRKRGDGQHGCLSLSGLPTKLESRPANMHIIATSAGTATLRRMSRMKTTADQKRLDACSTRDLARCQFKGDPATASKNVLES